MITPVNGYTLPGNDLANNGQLPPDILGETSPNLRRQGNA